jgi:CRISPR/Cas system Type II protein with McrA/HNH and RuvC-like nuclease domain
MNTKKWNQKKHRLAERDGGAHCFYCGIREKIYRLTIDHLVPRSRGGTHALANLVLACEPCNKAKGSQSLSSWQANDDDLFYFDPIDEPEVAAMVFLNNDDDLCDSA